jgi:hypothetical protein
MDMPFWLWLFRPRYFLADVHRNDCKSGDNLDQWALGTNFGRAVSNRLADSTIAYPFPKERTLLGPHCYNFSSLCISTNRHGGVGDTRLPHPARNENNQAGWFGAAVPATNHKSPCGRHHLRVPRSAAYLAD